MPSFLTSITAENILSFGPDAKAFALEPLNIVIGPNGSGKSNLVELFELLKSTGSDLGRVGESGAMEGWLWNGSGKVRRDRLPAVLDVSASVPGLQGTQRYLLELDVALHRLMVRREEVGAKGARKAGALLYSYSEEHAAILEKQGSRRVARKLKPESIDSRQSVFSQRRDPDLYPELTALGHAFASIQIFRDWSFGRISVLRRPQPADLPNDVLLPDGRNLGMVLNRLERTDAWPRFNEYLRQFLPRFERLSMGVEGGTVQIFLHERGLTVPVPAARISDGTIRFIALLAILLNRKPAPLICIEEPELGLHPDALRLVADMAKDASERTQVVMTTQSDVLVSAFSDRPESAVVCENVGGSTELRRLEADKLVFWLNKHKLGEVWRMGELGGNP